jgi:hypothetical protein
VSEVVDCDVGTVGEVVVISDGEVVVDVVVVGVVVISVGEVGVVVDSVVIEVVVADVVVAVVVTVVVDESALTVNDTLKPADIPPEPVIVNVPM